MNANNWTDEQWKVYETANVLVPVPILESLIIAAEAHALGIQATPIQKQRWQNMAKTAIAFLDKVVAKVEVI